jgi:hypothetical protein
MKIIKTILYFLKDVIKKLKSLFLPKPIDPMLQMFVELNQLLKQQNNQFSLVVKSIANKTSENQNFELIKTLDYVIDNTYFCVIKSLKDGHEYTVPVDKVFFQIKYGQNLTPITKKFVYNGMDQDMFMLIKEDSLKTSEATMYKVLVFNSNNGFPITDIRGYNNVLSDKLFETRTDAETKGWEDIKKVYTAALKKRR